MVVCFHNKENIANLDIEFSLCPLTFPNSLPQLFLNWTGELRKCKRRSNLFVMLLSLVAHTDSYSVALCATIPTNGPYSTEDTLTCHRRKFFVNADSAAGYARVIIALQPAVRTESATSICATNEEEELERHVKTRLTVLPSCWWGGVPGVIRPSIWQAVLTEYIVTFSVTLSWTRKYNWAIVSAVSDTSAFLLREVKGSY